MRSSGGSTRSRVVFGRRPKIFHVAELDVCRISNSEFARLRQRFSQRRKRCTPAASAPQSFACRAVALAKAGGFTQKRKRREDFHLLGANSLLNRLGETAQLILPNA